MNEEILLDPEILSEMLEGKWEPKIKYKTSKKKPTLSASYNSLYQHHLKVVAEYQRYIAKMAELIVISNAN